MPDPTDKTARELLACPNPWCGGDAAVLGYGVKHYAVTCQQCGLIGPRERDREDAISAWNTRAITAALSTAPAPEEWTRDLTPEEQKMIDRAWERHKAAGPIDLDELATRFCSAPLPDTVCADPCASMPGYPNRTGTNLLTVAEAREVLARVLADPAPEGES